MNRMVKINGNRSVLIVAKDSPKTALTQNDVEMDVRAKAAVKSAINRAIICKKPIAKYDRVSKKAYIENSNGEKRYV